MFPLSIRLFLTLSQKNREREREKKIEGRGIKSAIIARLNYEALVTSQWLLFFLLLSFFLHVIPRKYSLFIPSLHRDIAWLFKRDNLNLSLARLLRQTRKDLFYDVNKILARRLRNSPSRARVENTLSIAILLLPLEIFY